jgi:3-oxoacyl-[acyl-carrier-protein] synthase-3
VTALSPRPGATHARLLALGAHRPARVVTNDELAATLDTSDAWIRSRTGIGSRRIAGADESVVEMAVHATAKALAAGGLAPDALDLVVVATCTMPSAIPPAAPQVAAGLGINGTAAVDLNAACGGFCYALSFAADAVRAGSARHVAVVGSERLSDVTDWSDRSTAVLFGDGAAAVVVAPADEPGIGPVVWGSDGEKAAAITVPAGDGKLRMAGQAVFRWAATAMPAAARRACAAAGVEPRDLAAIVPHQANGRIIDAIVRELGCPQAVVARDIAESGNTSAASVPLALAALLDAGQVSGGDLALLLAFGAGLTYAGQVVRVP